MLVASTQERRKSGTRHTLQISPRASPRLSPRGDYSSERGKVSTSPVLLPKLDLRSSKWHHTQPAHGSHGGHHPGHHGAGRAHRLNLNFPVSIRACAALATLWLTIQILTSYPSIFLMFLYPILLAAILEPMKLGLWRFMWFILLHIGIRLRRLLRQLAKPGGAQDVKEETIEDFAPSFAEMDKMPRARPSLHSTVIDLEVMRRSTSKQAARSASKHSTAPTSTSYARLPEAGAEEGTAGQSRTESRGATQVEEKEPWPVAAYFLSSTFSWYMEFFFRKLLLIISIVLCLAVAGRVLIIIGQIVLHTAEQVAHDFPHYQRGATHRIDMLKEEIAKVTEEELGKKISVPMDIALVAGKQLLDYANSVAMSASTYLLQSVVPSTCITTLFVVFLMLNPVKAEGTNKEIIDLCFDFVKVKSALSVTLGGLVGLTLKLCGLELYYAAALLVSVANFIPNGALLCSLFPCFFALFDDRKRFSQVVTALVVEVFLINSFAFVVEPLFFGAAIEMHPIPAILGVTFFGYIWGVPGMLISIPILGAARLILAAYASRRHGDEGDDETAGFLALQHFIEGKWTTDATGLEEFDEHDLEKYSTQGDYLDDVSHHKSDYSHYRLTDVGSGAGRAHGSADPENTYTEEACAGQRELVAMETGEGKSPSSIVDQYERMILMLSYNYETNKVVIDGVFYVLLVAFLFSSLSDRVFGIYGEYPPAMHNISHFIKTTHHHEES
eukprot:TRINITY_DN4477_c1_g1_i1.p1 TRINITY_DN4477_c1_g1~~TRINITY_DN4477_c1_g1_i1.p1  ORF type:complete len:727 (-),score=121.53 TRINITY_DN4477_c1_g1_i1:96-2276(-)